jgi:A/G-specific adenine glycosylase
LTPFQRALIEWFDVARRPLPWRETRDPYAIWVSEMMLQQTQVATVIPYYQRWMDRFPDLHTLSMAQEADVLAVWQGLGYYRRAKALLAAAKQLSAMPSRHADLLKVDGIGPYSAGAIASIAYGEQVPLVDGNVERVFARVTSNRQAGSRLRKSAWAWADSSLLTTKPGDWNQALMELGATVCTPKQPDCKACPIKQFCYAYNDGIQNEIPARKPRRATILLERSIEITTCGTKVGIQPIEAGDWWQGMWAFPTATEASSSRYIGKFTHTVTHHRITFRVWTKATAVPTPGLRWIETSCLAEVAMPSPQRKAWRLFVKQLREPSLDFGD